MARTRVVVLEIFPKYNKMLMELLKALPNVDIIDNDVNNTEEALDFIIARKPDIVILGNDFPGVDGFYFSQVIRREASPTQVIMAAEVVTADSVRQAMRSGACEFVSYKKLTIEELSMAIDHASQMITDERKSRVAQVEKTEPVVKPQPKAEASQPLHTIVVYSSKTGAGVSTLTVNLACALASKKFKVLVVDSDFLFGDMEVLLNQRSNNSIADLVRYEDALDQDVFDVVINQGKVDLISAPSGANEALGITGPVFERILDAIRKLDYDFLLINTNTYLSDATILALNNADSIVLVATQEIATVRALSMFMDLATILAIDSEKFMLVINKYQVNSTLTTDKLTKRLEMPIIMTIPYDYNTVLEANNLGIPFVNENDKAAVSRSIFDLAKLFINGNNNLNTKLAEAQASLKKSLSKKKKVS